MKFEVGDQVILVKDGTYDGSYVHIYRHRQGDVGVVVYPPDHGDNVRKNDEEKTLVLAPDKETPNCYWTDNDCLEPYVEESEVKAAIASITSAILGQRGPRASRDVPRDADA